MKYYVGQVIEFIEHVVDRTNPGLVGQRLSKGRIYATHEGFAPQLDVRLEDGRSLGIMESEVLDIAPMDTIKDIMTERRYKCTNCGAVFDEEFTKKLFDDDDIRLATGPCEKHPISGGALKGVHFVKYDEIETIKKIMK